MRYYALAIICCCLFSLKTHAQLPPDKALQSFTVAEGLKLELFASEPMFINPTCMDIDERGRVWVCESVNYRCTLHHKPLNRPEGDRIVILHDTDGDGKADKATTFYQAPDFLAPLGIAVSKDPVGPGYKVYVCHSPHIYVFEDKDGDGKADGPPKILLTGFGGIDHDHGVHGIHFGPDGKLYFSVGDQGVKNLHAPGNSGGSRPPLRTFTTNQTDCKAGTIWRCNTDGSGLELLAHNFRNQYEPAVNSFGTMFVSDNDDDGSQQTRICHVMYGGDYGYWPRNRGDHHWHEDQPGVVHKTLRTGFGSPTGMCWYEGKLLHSVFSSQLSVVSKDAKYEGFLLHTDAGPREVRLFGVKPKGAGYELDRVNLVTSTDNWFRPSDVCVAPDGSVFIADWYDPGVGGHGMGDTTKGRIYRLTGKEHTGYSAPTLKVDDIIDFHEKMTEWMNSPNIALRHWALSVMLTTNWRMAGAQYAGTKKKNDWMSARAAWLLKHEKLGIDSEGLLELLNGNEDIPLIFRLNEALPPSYTGTKHRLDINDFYELAKKRNSMASYRELLLFIRQEPLKNITELFWELAKRFDGQDRAYLSALNIAVGTDPKRREAILADFEKHFPVWNDKTAWLVWELRPARVIAKLGRKLAEEIMSPQQTELALGALAASTGTDGGESLLKLLQDTKVDKQVRAAAIKTLLVHLGGKWSSLKSSILVRRAIEAQMTDGDMLPAVVELTALCERKDFQGFLERLAYNTDGFTNTVRYTAIGALGKLKTRESVVALTKLLNPREEPATRKEVMSALGKIGTSEAMKPLQTCYLDSQRDIDDRRMALESLAGSRTGTIWLLGLHDTRELPESMLADTARLLRNSPYQDLRNKSLVAFPISKKMDLAKLPSPAQLAKKVGHAERGKQLVHTNPDLGCIKCHGFQGVGGQIGPDLSMIGIKGSPENLFESILTPDKAIADQYIQHVVETKNGVIMNGLLVEETSDYLVLRDANGKDSKLALREVEKRSKSNKSLMPDNLASFMTEEDLVDVVAYLITMKSPALVIDRWQVCGPFPNDDKDSGLEKNHGPEKGFNANAKFVGKKGQVGWVQAVVNSTGYLDLAALHEEDAPMSVSYVYAEIEVTKAGWGDIKLGTDDGVNVLFNGKLVYRHRRHEAAQPGRDTVAVEFQEGKNTLLLKISNGNNPHGAYCTVLTPGTEPAKLVKLVTPR